MFKWAGVELIDPASRGPNIDARKLAFLETIFAGEFRQYGYWEDPFPNAANMLTLSWSHLVSNIKAQLIVQMGGAEIFGGTISYDVFTGELTGTREISEAALDDLTSASNAMGVDTEAYWLNIVEFIAYTKGLDNVTATEEGWLSAAIQDAGLTDTWDDLIDTYEDTGLVGGISNYGTTGDDTITGSAGTDILYGDQGNDTISVETAATILTATLETILSTAAPVVTLCTARTATM